MAEPTTEKLARALESFPAIPPAMVKNAREGMYDDFKSPLTFPEITLVAELRAVAGNTSLPRSARQEIERLAKRVINGEFDATPEESRAWAESPDGQETFRVLADDAVFGGIVRDMERREGKPGNGRD